MKILRLELDLYSLVKWTGRFVVAFRNKSDDLICTSSEELLPQAVQGNLWRILSQHSILQQFERTVWVVNLDTLNKGLIPHVLSWNCSA
jgi:hypothetical protein